MQPESRKPFQQAFSKNCLPASLFKKGLSENPWQWCDQTAQRKPFQKGLSEKPRNV
jgi:hypothetical protein